MQQKKCLPARNFSHAKSLSVLPRCCHRHAYSAIAMLAMVLCMPMPMPMPLSLLSGTLAVLGEEKRREGVSGVKRRKGLHEAFRQPCRRSALGASNRHASFEGLRPRYKSLAQGTCEFRSDSLVIITSLLEDWMEAVR